MLKPRHLSRPVSKILTDKRFTDRVDANFSAVIMEDGEFISHCIIRDVSVTGMKVDLPEKKILPERIEMKTPAVPDLLHLKVAWQSGKSVGAAFADPEEVIEESEEGSVESDVAETEGAHDAA